MAVTRPWAGSCRAGSVVHMQALTGAKIPVRLEIKAIEDNTAEKVSHRHVVKVKSWPVHEL